MLDAALASDWQRVSAILHAPDTEENELLRFLSTHDLLQPFYWMIQRDQASSSIPAWLLMQLIAAIQSGQERHLMLVSALREIVEQMALHQTSLVLLKGFHFSQALYGNLNARRVRDLDLLVSPADQSRISELLLELGYRDKRILPPHLHRRLVHATSWQRAGLELDLHHTLRVRPGYKISIDGLVSRAVNININELQIKVLAEADCLLLLLLSLSGDVERGVVRLKSLVDIWAYLSLHEADTDWRGFFNDRESEGVRGLTMAALRLFMVCLPSASARFSRLGAFLDNDHGKLKQGCSADLLSATSTARRHWYVTHSSANSLIYMGWWVSSAPLRWLSS
jgi:hypothetical protein